jgi:chromosome segregation ATPase
LNQRVAEPELTVLREQNSIEDYLKTLWDRVHVAGEMIRELRGEKLELHSRIDALERELNAAREEMLQREQELKRLRAERAQLLSSTGNTGFTDEERAALRGKIHDIISKINSHL